MLQVLELLGRRHPAGVEQLLVLGGAGAHLLDVGLGLGERALEVVDLGLAGDDAVAQRRDAALEVGDRRQLRQRPALVLDLGETGVERLQVEQAELDGGLGVHRSPHVLVWSCGRARAPRGRPWGSTVTPPRARPGPGGQARNVQGSVVRRGDQHLDAVLREVGLQARRHERDPRPLRREVRDVDHRRSPGREEVQRDVVLQVAGDDHVGAGRRGRVEVVATGSAEHRHPAYDALRVAGHADAVRRRRQGVTHALGERGEGGRLLEVADAAEPGVTVRRRRQNGCDHAERRGPRRGRPRRRRRRRRRSCGRRAARSRR